MPYSYIAENYCKTDYTGNGALYPDQGTSYTLWKKTTLLKIRVCMRRIFLDKKPALR
ncbi:MAG: hypothetical protein L6V93_05780 [Clostridiales bacterium]|nr:MAG: hypothetical protein L6V93_05780 [Clostridiales bacterium]